MAEIKSTLELALERTGKISISEEEKEEIKKREILLKASGLFNRTMEGNLSPADLTREIERMDAQTRVLIREAVLSRAIDAISIDRSNDRALKAIESLKDRGVGQLKEILNSVRSEYDREREEAEEEMLTRRVEALKKEGISGSAVVPNVQASREWREQTETLQKRFNERIENIREAFRKL